MTKSIHPLIHQAIDAAFCVIQEKHDPKNRFNAGGFADHYAERFETFDAIAEALAHYSDWEAARVKKAEADAAAPLQVLITAAADAAWQANLARQRAAALADEAGDAAALAEAAEIEAARAALAVLNYSASSA